MAIIELTMLFLASIIGAGFATGAEIVIFFGRLQLPASVIAVLVSIAIFLMMVLMIKTIPQMAKITTIIFDIIYLVLFTAMTAGITQIAGIGATIITLIVATLMVTFGFEKMTRLNTIIVVAIIVMLCLICGPNWHHFNWFHFHGTTLFNGVFWALLYAGLNGLMFPELIAAAATKHSRKDLYVASFLTALLVAFFVGLILQTIQTAQTQTAPIPLLAAVTHPLTYVVILLAILTSQYTALFAVIQRTTTLLPQLRKHQLLLTIGTCLVAFLGSFLGFNTILTVTYPLIGAFTCVFLLFSWVRC